MASIVLSVVERVFGVPTAGGVALSRSASEQFGSLVKPTVVRSENTATSMS